MADYLAEVRSVAWRLFFVLFCFVLLRWAFYGINLQLFSDTSFLRLFYLSLLGLRFDISAILYGNLLFVLCSLLPFLWRSCYDWLKQVIFVAGNAVMLAVSIVDIYYYPYTLKRMTWDASDLAGDLFTLLPAFIAEFWYLILIEVLLIGVLLYVYVATRTDRAAEEATAVWWKETGVFLLMCGFLIVGLRGGLQMKPLKPIDALTMAPLSEFVLLTNSPFTVFHSLVKQERAHESFVSLQEADSVINTNKLFGTDSLSEFRKLNVVFIVIESLSAEFINHPEGYTPFLDSLSRRSLFLPRIFANGKKSIEGIPAIFSGIPALMEAPFISSGYSTNPVVSLPALLHKEGYHTAFFHGARNGSMHFDAYARSAGFQDYYGRNEYGSRDFDGSWGVWDHKFLPYAAQQMARFEQPFCAGVFTLNPHHPYKLPKGTIREQAKHEFLGSLHYVDKAIRSFFKQASKASFHEHTLYVITADHTAAYSQLRRQDRINTYLVPAIVYSPSLDLPSTLDVVVQQIDLMPSVLQMLDYDRPFNCLGTACMESDRPNVAYQYLNGVFQAISKQHIVLLNQRSEVQCYDYVLDPTFSTTISSPECRQIEKQLKSFIEVYRNRLLVNNW